MASTVTADPNIALGYHPTNLGIDDPSVAYARALQARSLLQELGLKKALAPEQIAQAQIQTQQLRKEQEYQQNLENDMRNGGFGAGAGAAGSAPTSASASGQPANPTSGIPAGAQPSGGVGSIGTGDASMLAPGFLGMPTSALTGATGASVPANGSAAPSTGQNPATAGIAAGTAPPVQAPSQAPSQTPTQTPNQSTTDQSGAYQPPKHSMQYQASVAPPQVPPMSYFIGRYGAKTGPELYKSQVEFQKTAQAAQKAYGEAKAQEDELVSNGLYAIQKSDFNPDVVQMTLGHLAQRYDTAGQLMQLSQSDPERFKQVVPALIAQSDKQRTVAAAEQQAANRGKAADTAQQKFNLEKPELQAKALQSEISSTATKLATAADEGPEAYGAARAAITNPDVQSRFPAKMPADKQDILDRGLTAEQATQAAQQRRAKTETQLEIEAVSKDPKISIPARAALSEAIKQKQAGRSVNITNTPITSDSKESIAEQIARYQLPPITGFALSRNPAMADIMKKVHDINPDFSEIKYNNYKKTEQDATTGKIGVQSRSISTMMGHLNYLSEAADALKNNDLRPLNKISNELGFQVGGTPQVQFDTIVHRLAPEVAKAYIAGGGTADERKQIEADFSKANSPEQLHKAISTAVDLSGSLIKSLQDNYNRGTYGYGKQKLISDEAEQARQKLGSRSKNTNAVVVPDNVKKLLSTGGVSTGIHTLSDGSKWRKNADGSIEKTQ